MTTTVLPRVPELWHRALFYDDEAEYQAGVLSFVRDGLERGEPVLVAVPEPNLASLRAAMEPDEREVVQTADMSVAGRNPGRIIGSVLTAFVGRHPDHRVRIVGEPIWAGRTAEEYPACAEHEALINVALHDAPASILCPYDTSTLSDEVLHDATRTHPVLVQGAKRWLSPHYSDPSAVAATFDRPLPPPPSEADIALIGGSSGPGDTRRFVHEFATTTSLAPSRIADLREAVQELVINTMVHSRDKGLLTAWVTDSHLVCQVEDRGWIPDQLAGRRPPAPPDAGHGLYLVHQLADLVRIHRDQNGTTVRMHFALDDSAD